MEATQYTKSGEYHIAYMVLGDQPIDLLYVPTWIGQVEVFAEEPAIQAFVTRVCDFARVISFDRRGSGLSDPMNGPPTLEDQMDDVLAVMDAAGCERVALMGFLEGGPLAMLFAATHPDRVSSLVLYATFARARWAPDYDWVPKDDERDARLEASFERWGAGHDPQGAGAEQGGRPRVPRVGGQDGALLRQPGHHPQDHGRPSGRPTCATCCPRSGCPRWSCTGARTPSSRSSTAATWPSTSRARATWSSRAATACSRSATPRPSWVRSRSS